ncbi:hypothetical protein BJ122_12053 [Rhodopseudomonas faecalis]|uniref:Phasin protein n=1 Tax=Rhodopseudomonas faecalis TaxID=99655 RepID=A0A318TCM3_9BRAD|nr:hypothetical protein [Rhodopseudomonas faecalis]PYF01570.1 hypothetical protein BJ122_12053 [Rhodopseudomonas faecalis]
MNAMPSEKLETKTSDSEHAAAAAADVEAGIREFVRNDVAYLRRPLQNADGTLDPSAEAAVNNVNSLIQRVAGASLAEIEGLITELQSLRDLLHSEGQRVQREIAGYAQLSQAAMQSTRLISDNVAQWKQAAQKIGRD